MEKSNEIFNSLKPSSQIAYLTFSDRALVKMLALVACSPAEVGWHGTVLKTEERNYEIGDILLYPQEVTGTSIECNNEDEDGKLEYAKWQCELCLKDPVYFDTIAFHGHSHVRMAVHPSNIDKDFQLDIIEQLQENAFYIFFIINKNTEYNCIIADREDGKIYYNIEIDSETFALREIVADYKKYVEEISYGHQ